MLCPDNVMLFLAISNCILKRHHEGRVLSSTALKAFDVRREEEEEEGKTV